MEEAVLASLIKETNGTNTNGILQGGEIRSSMRINMANKKKHCRNMIQNCKLKHWKAWLFVTQHLGGKGHPSVVCSRPVWANMRL